MSEADEMVERVARIINPLAWNEVALHSWAPHTIKWQQNHARQTARAVIKEVRRVTIPKPSPSLEEADRG